MEWHQRTKTAGVRGAALDTAAMFRSAWRHVGAEVLKHQRCVGYSDVVTPQHRWYCVQVHPGHDFLAATLLIRRAFITFLPIMTDASDQTLEPMFPCYVFLAVNRQVEELLPRARVAGFRQMIGGGVAGQPVPIGIVETFIRRAGDSGVIGMDEDRTPCTGWAKGDQVVVVDGPFTSFTGVIQKSAGDRVRVLLSIFGRDASTDLASAAVAPA